MKKIILGAFALILTGCATHAEITMPSVKRVDAEVFAGKKLDYDIFYSQLEPGFFNGSEQQDLKPLEEAQLSIASAATLQNLTQIIERQLPASATIVENSDSDLSLVVELVAFSKAGPTYADHEFAKNLGKSMLTLGMGSSEYNIVADFNVTYRLTDEAGKTTEKSYRVEEIVDHERGKFESMQSVHDFAAQLLEKHLMLTLNDFFVEASAES